MKKAIFAAFGAALSLFSVVGCSSTAPEESTKEYQGELTFYPASVIPVFVKTRAPVDPACITTVGSCKLSDCAAPAEGDTVVSAGDLTISGGRLTAPLSLAFATKGYEGYPYGALPNGGYASGDTLHVSAAGADVAAFAGTTTAAPGDVVVTSPFITRAASADAKQGSIAGYTLDTSADLPITWTGGTAGSDVVVVLSNLDDASRVRSVVCTVDATTGKATLPVSLTGALGSPANGFFSVYSRTKSTLTSDNASVDVSVNGTLTAGTWTKP